MADFAPDPMDDLNVPLEAQELIDSYLGRAGMLANAIMMGLTEPDVEINPDVMQALGNEITDRVLALDPADARTPIRVRRAVEWASREDVQPEAALAFYAHTVGFISDVGLEEEAVRTAVAGFVERFSDSAFEDLVNAPA